MAGAVSASPAAAGLRPADAALAIAIAFATLLVKQATAQIGKKKDAAREAITVTGAAGKA